MKLGDGLLRLSEKQVSTFLYLTQGVGVIFAGIFLAAYLGGLPSTVVLHSEPTFRMLLTIFGVLFLVFIFVAVILSVLHKTRN
jgi:hypothetical protein